jgi:hypothetical protein
MEASQSVAKGRMQRCSLHMLTSTNSWCATLRYLASILLITSSLHTSNRCWLPDMVLAYVLLCLGGLLCYELCSSCAHLLTWVSQISWLSTPRGPCQTLQEQEQEQEQEQHVLTRYYPLQPLHALLWGALARCVSNLAPRQRDCWQTAACMGCM